MEEDKSLYTKRSNYIDKQDNDKTAVDETVERFYTLYPFLLEDKFLDLNLPSNKMRKLQY